MHRRMHALKPKDEDKDSSSSPQVALVFSNAEPMPAPARGRRWGRRQIRMLLLKAIKSFSFALLAISLLKQGSIASSINRIDLSYDSMVRIVRLSSESL